METAEVPGWFKRKGRRPVPLRSSSRGQLRTQVQGRVTCQRLLSRPAPPPPQEPLRSLCPAPSRVTARARSTEEVRRGLTWRGNVRLGRGGPWFCPEVGPVAGVSRNPRSAARPQGARGSTPFLSIPRVSQLEPLNLQRFSTPCSLGNTGEPAPSIFSPGLQSPHHWGTHNSGIPGPSSPRNIGSSALAPMEDLE